MKRLRNRLALRNRGASRLKFVFDDHVARGLRDDVEPIENWNTRGNHRPEGSREACDGDLLDDVAENRKLERQHISLEVEGLAPHSSLSKDRHEREYPAEHIDEVGLQPLGQSDDHLCRARQRAAEVGEHLLEDGNDLNK